MVAAMEATGRTILVVDDEDPIRLVISKVLSKAGHRVLEAEHGAEALRVTAAHDGRIDLIITDLYMPGMRGTEIAEQIRESHPETRVLYMSGFEDEDIQRSGVHAGASFLPKPFTLDQLSAAVAEALA
jgi:two-component system cell cycle sensor histidine kinase/response regulator CckA